MNDWTDQDGITNSSEMYLAAVKEVDGIIRTSGNDLINGRSLWVARHVVSMLVNRFKLAPPVTAVTDIVVGPITDIHGPIATNGEPPQ